MLTIICGEDAIASREYFLNLKQEYIKKNYEIYNTTVQELPEISKWLAESSSLFSFKRVYFIESLNKKISRRNNLTLYSLVENLAKKKDIEIIDWEEYAQKRELKISEGITVKEFKLSTSIFKLLDSCYPKNLKTFVQLLHSLPEKLDDMFIFVMLIRHMHNLFVIKHKGVIKSLQSWQVAKLKSQARLWDSDKLDSFYEGLYRIEVSVKSGKNPFSLRKSLDLLACYFL